MQNCWRLILPIAGLLFFTGATVDSLQARPKAPSRYLWWSAIRLDSYPLDRYYPGRTPCPDAKGDCAKWFPAALWVSPGLVPELLVLSAFPALVIGMSWVRILGLLGINEISSFMSIMPLLVGVWYFAMGWLIDHWLYKRRLTS